MDYGSPTGIKWALARYLNDGSQDGTLDTGFGTDGKVVTDFSTDASKSESATGVAVQTDGKIVVVGQAPTATNSAFGLARYNANGSLDTDFSTDGMVVTSIGAGGSASAVVVLPDGVLPDGKILVGGSTTASGGTHGDFTVVQYDSYGNVDTSFGVEGVARADFGETSVLIGLALDAGGGIVASGYSYDGTNHGYFALARFDSAGALDMGFGTGGLVKTDFGFTTGAGAYGEGLVIQPGDGKIVQVGDCRANDNDPDFCVARFEGAGAIEDSTPPVITPDVTGTFGTNGWYIGDVALSWTVTDPESTVTSQTGCRAVAVTSDTAGTTFTCEATSTGGTSSASVTIKRDATPPTATASAQPSANANGWRKQDVTVTFSGTDTLSGGVTCDPPVVLSTEGANQSASGYCYDAAGNQSLATVSGINIDKTPPTVTINTPKDGGIYSRNQTVMADFICDDTLSGKLSCSGTVDNGQLIDTSKKVKNAKFTVTATDKAGNTTKQTVSYSVQ